MEKLSAEQASSLGTALAHERKQLEQRTSRIGKTFALALAALTAGGCSVTTVGGHTERSSSGRTYHEWQDTRAQGDFGKLCAEIARALETRGTKQYRAEHTYKDGTYELTGIEVRGQKATTAVRGPDGITRACK